MTHRHKQTGWLGYVFETTATEVLVNSTGMQWTGTPEAFTREWEPL